MNRTAGFISGITTGMVVGAAVTMLIDPVSDRQRHQLQKKTEGVFRSIGGVIDTAMELMR